MTDFTMVGSIVAVTATSTMKQLISTSQSIY
nr:MAG TPA: hypothetical protein [Caudoviricetes sp.]